MGRQYRWDGRRTRESRYSLASSMAGLGGAAITNMFGWGRTADSSLTPSSKRTQKRGSQAAADGGRKCIFVGLAGVLSRDVLWWGLQVYYHAMRKDDNSLYAKAHAYWKCSHFR